MVENEEHQKSHQEAAVLGPESLYADDLLNSGLQVSADAVDDDVITWEASEYVYHEKDSRWYAMVFIGGIFLTVIIFFLVDWFSALIIILLTVALVLFSQRQPRTLRYTISQAGISIGDRNFSYDEFKSFSILQEGGLQSILLTPVNRVKAGISIYFSPQNLDQIADALSHFLPYEEKEIGIFDEISRRLRL